MFARQLQPGMTVTGPIGEIQSLTASTREEHPEGVPVYNFRVSDYNTYFVSESEDGVPILVHNSCYRDDALKHANSRVGKDGKTIEYEYYDFDGTKKWTSDLKSLHGDHRFPKDASDKAIKKWRDAHGKKPLPKAKQDELEALLNSADNLELMKGRYNSSKGSRTGQNWKDTPLGKEADAEFIDYINKKQKEIGQRVADILGDINYLPDDFQNLFKSRN